MCSLSLAVGQRSCSLNVYTLFVDRYHCTVCCMNHGILIVVNKRPLATSSTANSIASSEMRFFNLSTVRPETHTPALLKMAITRELVPFIFRNKPIISGKILVGWFRTKISMLIAIMDACKFITIVFPHMAPHLPILGCEATQILKTMMTGN